MKAELIQALSNLNINSGSAEIIASEYISYLYFSKAISSVSVTIGLWSIAVTMYYLFRFIVKHCE
jgi:hypothetical protein